MSFGTYARKVRDARLPYGQRYLALRSAVTEYCPLGFDSTWDYLVLRAGRVRRDASALLRALDILETSRNAWLAEVAESARRRTAEKRVRRVPRDDRLDGFRWRWPGPDGHDAMYRTAEALSAELGRHRFPEGLPPNGELALRVLERRVRVCLSGYFEQNGRLLDRDRATLRSGLGELRAVVGFPRTYPAAFARFWSLYKLATIVAYDSFPPDTLIEARRAPLTAEPLPYAFPGSLSADVAAVCAIMPPAGIEPSGAYQATVLDDSVIIPYRIHHDEPDSRAVQTLSRRQRLILHCLYTRHHDGFVRQRHLAEVIGCLEEWVMPYVVPLAGDHVLEIVTDVRRGLGDLAIPGSTVRQKYGRFVLYNQGLLHETAQRAASFWNVHHRQVFPERSAYPGDRVIRGLKAAYEEYLRR